MARCEDYPCCGHELGCCPDYDPDTGRQLNMKCTCGAVLPVNNRYSICDSCMNDERYDEEAHDLILEEQEREDFAQDGWDYNREEDY